MLGSDSRMASIGTVVILSTLMSTLSRASRYRSTKFWPRLSRVSGWVAYLFGCEIDRVWDGLLVGDVLGEDYLSEVNDVEFFG